MKTMQRTFRLAAVALILSPLVPFAQEADAPSPAAGDEVVLDEEGGEIASPAMPPMMLRLRSGAILWGSVLEHDPDGIRFRRVSTGGIVQLAWGRLDPAEEGALRLRFGYVDSGADEIMVTADRFQLINGTEIIGLIESRTDQHLFVKTAERTIPVAKSQVAGASTTVQVPALDIFTKDELYQRRVLELQAELLGEGTDAAEANFALAQYCERLFDYARALHHYRKTAELDPEFEAEEVAPAAARCEVKAAQQEQVDMLAEIDRWRARKRYDRAIELLGQFPERFPNSPLLEDWNKLRDRVAKYQERDLAAEIVRLVYSHTTKLTRKAARDKTAYESLLAYLEEGLLEDLRQAVVDDIQQLAPGIEPDEMQRFWDARERGRRRTGSYGFGTWLLGEDRALALPIPEDEKKSAPEEGSQAEAREKLQQRIARYLQNQELARKTKSGDQFEEEDPAKFWSQLNLSGRSLWTLAYFVEFSGLFRLDRVYLDNCRACGGAGAREVLFTGSAVSGDSSGRRLRRCTTCHGIGRVRRIKYR
jgi:hypothetical protein